MTSDDWKSKADPVRPLLPTGHALILCFFSGALPANASAMLRTPAPEVGVAFDYSFERTYRAAVALNPSVHDGAILIGRDGGTPGYRVRGWSYRLFSPSRINSTANKGSAWNSCLAMSMDEDVEAMVLASGDELIGLVKGVAVLL